MSLEEFEVWISIIIPIYMATVITGPLAIWFVGKTICTDRRKKKKWLKVEEYWHSVQADIISGKLSEVICRKYDVRTFDVGKELKSLRKFIKTYVIDGVTYWELRHIEDCAQRICQDIQMRIEILGLNQKSVGCPLYKKKEYNQIKKDIQVARRKYEK